MWPLENNRRQLKRTMNYTLTSEQIRIHDFGNLNPRARKQTKWLCTELKTALWRTTGIPAEGRLKATWNRIHKNSRKKTRLKNHDEDIRWWVPSAPTLILEQVTLFTKSEGGRSVDSFNVERQVGEGFDWSHFKDQSLDHLWQIDFNLRLTWQNLTKRRRYFIFC